MSDKKTIISFDNYYHDIGEDIYYIGLGSESSRDEIDALISLLFKEFEVTHQGRVLKNIKRKLKEDKDK